MEQDGTDANKKDYAEQLEAEKTKKEQIRRRQQEMYAKMHQELCDRATSTRLDHEFDKDTMKAVRASLSDPGQKISACDAHSVMIAEQEEQRAQVARDRAARKEGRSM